MITLISGIILAGGASKRMKQNKMMLHFKEQPIIHHTIQTMSSVCNEIVIVTGFYETDYLRGFNYNNSIKQVLNPEHLKGMLTSIQQGIRNIENDCFIIPGDYPLVNPKTYQQLLDAKGDIRVPTYHGKRGHPIYISRSLFEALIKEPVTSSLKQFRDRHDVTYVEVEDPNILFDIDDMMEYQKLLDMERMD